MVHKTNKRIGGFDIDKSRTQNVTINSIQNISKNFNVQSEMIKNDVLITNKLYFPLKRGLPEFGALGEIVFNSIDSTFYGWNGDQWIGLGSSSGVESFERVFNGIIDPNITTSLIVDADYIMWGTKVGGAFLELSLFFNQIDINNSDVALVGVITLDEPTIYNGDGTPAFTLPYLGSSFNNPIIKYSSNGIPSVVGNIYSDAFFEEYLILIYAVSINNNEYSAVSGWYENQIFICDGTYNTVASLPSDGSDIFLITYTPTNSLQWATRISGIFETFNYNSWNTKIIDNGKSLVSGSFYQNTLTIYSVDNSFTTCYTNVYAGFLAKYDSTGQNEWIVKVEGTDLYTYAVPSDMDNAENIVVSASTSSSLTAYNYDGSEAIVLERDEYSDLAGLFCYSTGGTLNWAAKMTSTDLNVTSSKLNSNGNIVVSGNYSGDQLNIYNLEGTLKLTLPPSEENDIFVIKWSNGEPDWAAKIGGINQDFGSSVDINDSNNIVVIGLSSSTSVVIYNANGNPAFTLYGPEGGNLFLVNYEGSGEFKWASIINPVGSEGNGASSVAINNLNNIIISGTYESTLNLLSHYNLPQLTLTNDGFTDVFIVKYNGYGEATLGNPDIDGVEKIITTNVPITVIGLSPFDDIGDKINLDSYESIEMIWDSVGGKWIVIETDGEILS